ncbi:cupin domain-containing protein [Kribbella sp. NPDC056861]|uniref:cupin domain-containing protein n=1 Tax=Kribbella sp. NPDC056861 TaxID=3154857 RepID=UPI00342D916F
MLPRGNDDGVRVVGPTDAPPMLGPQGQILIPCVTNGSTGSAQLSTGLIVMPPATTSQLHLHAYTDIVVMCLRGWAATLTGPEFTPHLHGPGEFIYIPAGLPHIAVNLSETDNLIAAEVRTDPYFNSDVVLLPEQQSSAVAASIAFRETADTDSAEIERIQRLESLDLRAMIELRRSLMAGPAATA